MGLPFYLWQSAILTACKLTNQKGKENFFVLTPNIDQDAEVLALIGEFDQSSFAEYLQEVAETLIKKSQLV